VSPTIVAVEPTAPADAAASERALRRVADPAHGTGPQRWDDVDVHDYKVAGSAPFRGVTRQVLFERDELACQVRYFEVEPGGHSTLERHEHVHAVVVLHGRGRCLVGTSVLELGPRDLVEVPPMTWHQFRAADDAPLGFLCIVNVERDRPQLPTGADLEALCADPTVASFVRVAD